jgi:hypothetical protein
MLFNLYLKLYSLFYYVLTYVVYLNIDKPLLLWRARFTPASFGNIHKLRHGDSQQF